MNQMNQQKVFVGFLLDQQNFSVGILMDQYTTFHIETNRSVGFLLDQQIIPVGFLLDHQHVSIGPTEISNGPTGSICWISIGPTKLFCWYSIGTNIPLSILKPTGLLVLLVQ